jgi:YegS/Rv2252/BmrU family lipid kinase
MSGRHFVCVIDRPTCHRSCRSRDDSSLNTDPGFSHAIEHALMHRWSQRPRDPIDRLLVMLTDAGDYSALWLVLAAALALGGGERGRRAAKHGLLALGFTSASVNGPLKLLVGRRRPTRRRAIRRNPRTSSSPSGHAASAFAFATAVTRDLPGAGLLLVPLAGAVAYSRVYVGVHYPSDVLAGAAIGTVAGLAVGGAARTPVTHEDEASHRRRQQQLPSEAILVASPHAGRSSKLACAKRALDQQGVVVTVQLDVGSLGRLPQLLRSSSGEPRLVIAAGGDGTVGSVAACLAGLDNTLAILPLGTANDYARSLGIPMSPRRAARLLAAGRIAKVDLGGVTRPDEPVRYFAHAAAAGLNVTFASVATRASTRARLGRLTYLAAASYAARKRSSFNCALRHDGKLERLTLLELSVINAPIFGGQLGLRVPRSAPDDGEVVVLAVGDMPLGRLLRIGLFLVFGIERPVEGIRAMRVTGIDVESQSRLGLALDGEIASALPARFDVAPGVLRVIIPQTD